MRVVLVGAVGHLDDQTARRLDEQREREMAGDGVRVDRQPQRAQPVVQVRFPDRLVPLDLGRAPDVVHQDVEPPLLALDAAHQRADLLRHEMVHLDRDPAAAGLVDRAAAVSSIVSGRFISDRWLAVVRPVQYTVAPAAPELDRDPASRAARRTGDQRHPARQRSAHGRLYCNWYTIFRQ